MAQKMRLTTPASMGGLVRYYEEDKAIIKFKPEHIVAICVGFAVLEILLLVMFR